MKNGAKPLARFSELLKLISVSLLNDVEGQMNGRSWKRLFADFRISDPGLNVCSNSRVLIDEEREWLNTSWDTENLVSEFVNLRKQTGNMWYGVLFDFKKDGKCSVTYMYEPDCKIRLLDDDGVRTPF